MLVWEVMGRQVFRQSTVNKGMGVIQIEVLAFPIGKSFYRCNHSPLPCTEREAPLRMEIFLINVNCFCKRRTSTWFQSFSGVYCFLKIISLNNPYAKKAYFGVTNSAPSLVSMLELCGLNCLIYLSGCTPSNDFIEE